MINYNNRLLAPLLTALLFSLILGGCKTTDIQDLLKPKHSTRTWYSISSTENIPSLGEILYDKYSKKYSEIGSLESRYGKPNYVSYNTNSRKEAWNPSNEWIKLIYNKHEKIAKLSISRHGKVTSGITDFSDITYPNYYPVETLINEAKKKEKERLIKKREEEERKAAAEAEEEAKQIKELQRAEREEAEGLLNLDLLNQKAEAKKKDTLVVKSFYIGMPMEDFLQLVNYYSGYPQVLPTKHSLGRCGAIGMCYVDYYPLPEHPYVIMCKDDGFRISRNPGSMVYFPSIADADDAGRIIRIRFNANELNNIFNKGDMSDDAFLQAFINGYNIPKLDVEKKKYPKNEGYQISYSYKHPGGSEICYYGEEIVFNLSGRSSYGEAVGSMIMKKIKTAKERELKL